MRRNLCLRTPVTHLSGSYNDVVEVTDAGAGLSAARRRVLAMSLRYVRGRPAAYDMRLRLGAV